MAPETSQLSVQLPLFQLRDFDILLNQSWPVGVDSDYPSELRVRLSAASISYQMGNKSIDHVAKRYLNDLVYEETPTDRLDKKISRFIKEELSKLDRTLAPIAPTKSVLGEMVSKWTFLRLPFSFDVAITCAQRGALYECLAIVRMILEQVAWSLDVQLLDDFHEITSRRASHSLGAMKSIHPSAGRFYGWLSEHAHWAYDAHIKTFQYSDKSIGMLLANPLYKGQALGAILLLFAISQEAYRCLIGTLGGTAPSAEAGAAAAASFLQELRSLAPQDKDIKLLQQMIEMKHGET
jgi:hypothetical protein